MRLADIVEEVDSRLRGVKSQAGKARRYKEYTERLQHLRTHVGQADWYDLSLRLQKSETRSVEFRENALATARQAESLEAETLCIEGQIETIRDSIRAHDARAAAIRESIASGLSTVELERRRTRELEDTLGTNRQHLARMSARAGDLVRQLRETGALVAAAESEFTVVETCDRQAEYQLSARMAQIHSARELVNSRRDQQRELLNETASLSKQLSAAESQHAAAVFAADKFHQRLEQLRPICEQNAQALDALSTRIEELVKQRNARLSVVENTRKNLSTHRQQLHVEQQNSLRLQGETTSCTERANVLQEMEQRLEGVNVGVKEVLRRARKATSGPLTDVVGLVADLLQVNVEAAHMVEVALGDLAHYVVLRGDSLVHQLRTGGFQIAGRVGFLRSDQPAPPGCAGEVGLAGQPGVLGRADQFVAASGPLAELIQRLLGTNVVCRRPGSRHPTVRTIARELPSRDPCR